MKTKKTFLYVFGFLLSCYLIVDIIHFIEFRNPPNYPKFPAAYYESKIISLFKWGLSIIALIGLFVYEKRPVLSYVLITVNIVNVLLLFFLKGLFVNLIKGSFVFNIALLEVSAFGLFLFINKNSSMDIKKRLLINVILISLCLFGIKNLPAF